MVRVMSLTKSAAACLVVAANVAVVTAEPKYKRCNQNDLSSFSAMGGAWTQDDDSASISNSNNIVTVTLPGSGVAGVFVQTSAGNLATGSFTAEETISGCTNVIASETAAQTGPIVVTVNGLTAGNCGSVEFYLGYSSGYTAGTILSKTMDLCGGATTTTADVTTTTAAATTTTTEEDEEDEEDGFGYQFKSSGGVNVYWYVQGSNIKLFFDKDFSSVSGGATDKWLGIGLREGTSGMGPAHFYVGQSIDNTVVPCELTTSAGLPSTVVDNTVSESACEVVDDIMYCSVTRTLAGDSSAPDLNDEQYLLWGFGTTDSQGFPAGASKHGTSDRGAGTTPIDFAATAPTLGTVSIDGEMEASWSPTPVGNLDVFMSTVSSGAAGYWVGVGFGESSSGMGPGQFYTGVSGDSPPVTDRSLSSTAGNPTARSTSNVISSTCEDDGTNLNCSFTRPLADDSSDAVSVEENDVFIRYGHGSGDGSGGILKHAGSARDITGSAVALYSVDAGVIAEGSSDSAALYKAHGILMVISWLFLLPFGVFAARFRDAFGLAENACWFKLHQAMQYTGVALMFFAFILVLVAYGGAFVISAHSIIGIITFCLALSQPIVAVLRNGVNEKDEKKKADCHHTWHIIHAITGYLAIVLAIVACYLGMLIFTGVDVPVLFLAGFIVSLAGLVLFAIAGIAILVGKAKSKSKNVNESAQTAKEDPKAEDADQKTPSYTWVAILLLVVLLTGSILCAVQIGLDTSRG